MAKIQAYRYKGNLIPVDQARVCTAYCCPWTGELFARKQSYVKHLQQLRQSKRVQRAAARRASLSQRLHDTWIGLPDFESVIDWVELHPDYFFDRVKSNITNTATREAARDLFSVRITHLAVSYMDSVSNTHTAPRSGVTNWDRKENLPRGYPGWSGRIEFSVTGHSGFGSDIFRGTGIHTGSGGSTSDGCYGYSLRMFASDWPGLESQLLLDLLANRRPGPFVWGTPKYFTR